MNYFNLISTKFRKYTPVTALLVTIGGYVAAQMVGVIAVVLYGVVRGWTTEQMVDNLGKSMWLSMIFSLLIYGFYVLVIRAYLKLSGHSFKDIGLKMPKSLVDVLAYVFIGYTVYFVSMLIATLLIKNSVPAIDLDQKQDLGFDTYTTGWGLLPIFITLVIIPPIVEEIITRGFLYTGLRKSLNVWGAGIITSIIFGAAHLQWGGSAPLLWAAAVDTFILSAVLIYLREKTGNLAPAIGLHMLKNFMAFLGLFIFHVA